MLFSMGHGQRIQLPSDSQLETSVSPPGTMRLSAVAPGAKVGNIPSAGVESGLSGTDVQSFGYFFPDVADVVGTDAATVNALKALAEAMTEVQGDPEDANGEIAPIFTYFGQFIDHDITANTDRDAPAESPISVMTGATVEPLDRSEVVSNIVNLRNGTLQLDSLYGEGPSDTPFTRLVRAALRDPNDQAKMLLGTLTPTAGGAALPLDRLADLPRLGELLDDPASGLTEANIDNLDPGEFRDGFKKDGIVKRARAMIGDGRNDENLLVAQFHLAFLRFHNAIADDLVATVPDAEDRFAKAKQLTIHIYQWLVINVYLPKICQPSVVEGVLKAQAPLYRDFKERVAGAGSANLPLPLEFSVAAFRFGHSMVRAVYDHNDTFPEATFLQLFSFTGGDSLGQEAIGMTFDRLPANWVIDWNNFAFDTPNEPNHRARMIDTQLAPPLSNMFKESDADSELGRILRHLAERNLRRSHRLNIPTGQDCVAAINAFDGSATVASVSPEVYKVAYSKDVDMPAPDAQDGLTPLSRDALNVGDAGAALDNAGMLGATPLWFYCLREAELSDGDSLGPLGSRIVAETLIGLVVQDDESYWNQSTMGSSWTPADNPIAGTAIMDLPSMLKVAGLLA